MRRDGARIGLVPTMGYLHEGHLSLVDRARELAERVVVTIFVNPLQFGPGEDYERYPRGLKRDGRLLDGRGADLLFTPDREQMFPRGAPSVLVTPGPMGERLCGAFRPGHFAGVLTVVAKLFNVVAPDVAVFGRKDFQQGVLIRAMVRDLAWPIAIELAPIVREADGLAMSSRNGYLSVAERRQALSLSRGLARAQEAFRGGERRPGELRALVRRELGAAGLEPQYVELVDPTGLEPVERAEAGHVLALAAYVGATRLIDNLELDGGVETGQRRDRAVTTGGG
jgi:pantoate--beta-alanine ligase